MKNTKVGNAKFIKNLNQNSIFKLIYQLGPITRKQLAEKTNYSSATISNHVNTLLKKSLVIETEKGFSTGGRKPVYLTVNPAKGYIISIEIEVVQVKLLLFNLKLKIEDKKIISINNNNSPEETLDKIDLLLQEIIEKNSLKIEDIMGIGVAVPGLIDKKSGLLEFAPNLQWSKIRITDYFKNKYDVQIILENEAKAAAVGEHEFIYPERENMVFVSVNEGIGCGIIFNGRLYRGASGNAGEFGHIIIDRNGPKCHCGNNGCWETLASENYILKAFQKLNFKSKIKSKNDIYELEQKDNQAVLNIFQEVGFNLGIGLVNIINSLSPDLIVLGGGIIKIKDYIDDEIVSVIKNSTLPISYNKVDLEYTKLDQLATVYGLAKIVFEKMVDFA